MDLADKILIFMRKEAYMPLSAEDLADAMSVRGKDLAAFWRTIDQLEAKAAIIKTRHGKYGVPERMNLTVGSLSVSAKGFGFLIPEDPETADVFIPPNGLGSAMHKDKVVVRVSRRQSGDPGKAFEGEVIRIVERANLTIVGTFEADRNFGFVLPDDQRLGQDIFVSKEDFNGATTGAKVVVKISKWPEKKKSAEGKIIEILGMTGEPGIEILSIIKKHNLPTSFPPEVEQAASSTPETILPAELEGRRDLRSLLLVTIDSEDAKDLDDAVHIERLPNGRYLLGVHIADVSYYVRENTPLDKEALNRGTSVYLVDRVLPMLPRRLSNGICSLNAAVERLALSVHMEIDSQGKVLKYEIFPSVIKVHTRLSYNIVRQILADHTLATRQKYAELVPALEEMERLCRILRDRRLRRGAIDFDFPEIKVKLDEQGHPLALEKRTRSIAESVVEEFMLVANETVAEHMSQLGLPSVFRVHEEPDHEKMVRLNLLLNNFGQRLGRVDNKDGEVQPMALQKVLSKIAGRPEERIISTVMLRSLKQARYDATNLGHFGLAASYYTHFTSPIRRYPDLIVHRIIHETFSTGDLSAKRRQKLTVMLPEIALHASQRERGAAEAERETVDLKKVEYMAQFIGEEFDSIISGVTAFGFFTELPNGVEGLVRVSSMDDDYYQYVEEQYALIGERTGKTFRLGDAVRVIVTNTNPELRTIDFVLATGFLSRPSGNNRRNSRSTNANPSKGNSKSTNKNLDNKVKNTDNAKYKNVSKTNKSKRNNKSTSKVKSKATSMQTTSDKELITLNPANIIATPKSSNQRSHSKKSKTASPAPKDEQPN